MANLPLYFFDDQPAARTLILDIHMNMRAWVLDEPGGPEAFVLKDIPRPVPNPGQVLIRVHAFGLNRSEYFTRIGDSPTVMLPRVLGIECAGVVVSAPDGSLKKGQRVVAMMNGMGRAYDGSYAEYTCVPRSSVFPIESSLPWEVLGALPEMLQTTHGSLTTGLGALPGETLLIRGGTSSVGLTTLALAKTMGLRVATTTRSETKRDFLMESGADEVFLDHGELSAQVRETHPDGVDRVLELIGTTTLLDSLQCARPGGVVCMTGILGGQWSLSEFHPMGHIPTGVRLTSYSGGADDISALELQDYVSKVESGQLKLVLGKVWDFEDLRDAHAMMDANTANGKMVVQIH
jgi:NADPH2:quinone reductase